VTTVPALRPDLDHLSGYHSPQEWAEVRLNTNESPFPPPEAWLRSFEQELVRLDFNRYPDRGATDLRHALAELHGVRDDEVFCANGSNEALQCLLLAFGGPGRRVALFEPTYALHAHISALTGTEVVGGGRDEGFLIDPADADRVIDVAEPAITFVCSPNNPTGRSEPRPLVEHVLGRAPGLVVVDEAYGQFSSWSALDLRRGGGHGNGDGAANRGLVVVRTFSKTWSMAGVRLGYLIADPEVVAACGQVVLPYHLSAVTQLAGVLALRFHHEMEARVALIAEERGRVSAELAGMPVQTWASDANFILFRPQGRDAAEVWRGLLDRSVLIRDCSSWEGLAGCLRVTIGTPGENDRFLDALRGCL
jgi:histidinol-phosphate aminotransferase